MKSADEFMSKRIFVQNEAFYAAEGTGTAIVQESSHFMKRTVPRWYVLLKIETQKGIKWEPKDNFWNQ